MNKILVTGGAGNLGSALVAKLSDNPENRVVIVDNLRTGEIKNVPVFRSNIHFIKADVNKLNEISPIMVANSFDYVFHYAALVGVKRTLAHPVDVLNDIDGIKNILDLSKNLGVKRIIFSSSSEVYGEAIEVPQKEDTTPLNARLPYAVVKNLGEVYLKAYQREYGLPYNVYRFFNTYGPNQTEDFVIPRFLKSAIRGEDLVVYGDGLQTRTFCYVDDNVEATIRASFDAKYVNKTINIGSDIEISIIDLAENILKIVNSRSGIKHVPPLKEGDMARRLPDIATMKNILQRDLIPLDEGIRKLLHGSDYGK